MSTTDAAIEAYLASGKTITRCPAAMPHHCLSEADREYWRRHEAQLIEAELAERQGRSDRARQRHSIGRFPASRDDSE